MSRRNPRRFGTSAQTSQNHNNYAAEEHVSVENKIFVNDMYYKLDGEEYGELSYGDFILRLIEELQVNRRTGYVRLYLYPREFHFNGEYFAIFIRKKDLYVIGVQDTRQQVYEVGTQVDGVRYFIASHQTGFGEDYEQLFGNNGELRGIDLGYPVLDDAIRCIIDNKDNPLMWARSIGVFALMWSECARFKWFHDVLKIVMGNHRPIERRGPIQMERQYEFMSVLPKIWRRISDRALSRFRENERDEPQPDDSKHTKEGALALRNNKRWAWDSLSIRTWGEYGPEVGYGPGGGVGRGYGNGGGGYADIRNRVVQIPRLMLFIRTVIQKIGAFPALVDQILFLMLFTRSIILTNVAFPTLVDQILLLMVFMKSVTLIYRTFPARVEQILLPLLFMRTILQTIHALPALVDQILILMFFTRLVKLTSGAFPALVDQILILMLFTQTVILTLSEFPALVEQIPLPIPFIRTIIRTFGAFPAQVYQILLPMVFTRIVLLTISAFPGQVKQISLPMLFMRTIIQIFGAYSALVDHQIFLLILFTRLVTMTNGAFPARVELIVHLILGMRSLILTISALPALVVLIYLLILFIRTVIRTIRWTIGNFNPYQ